MKKTIICSLQRLFSITLLVSLLLSNLGASDVSPVLAQASDPFNFTTLQFASTNMVSVTVYETGNKAFVGDATNNAIIVLNGTTNQVITTITGVPGGSGGGMIVNETYGKVYFYTNTNTGVLDANTYQILSLALPKGYLVHDEIHDKLYIVNGNAVAYNIYELDIATDSSHLLYSGSGNFDGATINPVTHELAILIYHPARIDFINVNTLAVNSFDVYAKGGDDGLVLAVNTLENKYYATLIFVPGQGQMGIFILDRDTNSYAFVGKSDLEPLVFNPQSNTLFSGVQVGTSMGVVDGATDKFTMIDVRTNSNAGHGAGGVRYSTDHGYFISQNQIAFVDNATKTVDFLALPIVSRGGLVISDIAVNQSSGKVYVIADNEVGKVFVLQDPPANGVGAMIQDGGLESGTPNPYWKEYSHLGYGNPLICNASSCGGPGAHTGSSWAAFGGAADATEMSQTGVIPSSADRTALNFWLRIPSAGIFQNSDSLAVEIDGTTVYEVTGNKAPAFNTYKKISLDISAYADGGVHEIEFISLVSPLSGNPGSVFYVDDVELVTSPTIQFSNDDFAHPIIIGSLPYTNTQDTSTAAVANNDPTFNCMFVPSQGYSTIWYSFTPSSTNNYTVNTFGSNYDTVLGVWTSGLTSVGCNDNLSGLQSQVQVSLLAGQTYYIEVAGYGTGGYGNLTLHVLLLSAPGSFGKSSPANGATNQSTAPTLSWDTSVGATSYEYCYDTTNDNACSTWTSNGISTSKVLSGLSAGTTYYWHVRAINTDGTTYANGSSTAFWSFTTSVIASGGGDTTGVFRPSNGLLYLKNTNATGFADVAINYGTAGDYPVTGDWDGNGTSTIGIYRNGSFYLRNSNTLGFADWVFAFGQPGDQPVAGDWNGDGTDTIGIYRPSTGQFLLRDSNSAGAADYSFYLGNVGDVGIAGDWTAKGFDTVGVFRPSNGIIFLKNTNQTGFADIALNYGLAGDQPVVGDWDGNGTDTIGVYRNAQFLLRNSNTIGFAEIVFGLGNPGDMPIAGDWDGLP